MRDQHLNGQPAWTSNWLKIPALDFPHRATDRATISHPTSGQRRAEFLSDTSPIRIRLCRSMTPRHQMRRERRLARACSSAGSMVSRRYRTEPCRGRRRFIGGHRLDHFRRQRSDPASFWTRSVIPGGRPSEPAESMASTRYACRATHPVGKRSFRAAQES